MPLKDFQEPTSWAVGETISADLWTERVHEPVSLLLRRPLTIARRTADQSIPSGSVQTVINWQTLDIDSDGMVIDDTASTWTLFYAQRDGVYSVYCALPFESNTDQGIRTNLIYIFINGVQQCRKEAAVFGGGSTQDNWRSLNADINLSEGDTLSFYAMNTNGTFSLNIKAQFNAPRCIIAWKRPLGS